MWQIENLTPFAAAQGWIRDRDGAETWLVVVKATFDVSPNGSTAVSLTQPDVTRSPIYRGDPESSSILYENDFVLTKRTTDVVLNGTAYAPPGTAVSSLDASFEVGPVKKKIRVLGDRIWKLGGFYLSDPEPFTRMPLIYELAFGGRDEGSANAKIDWYWPNPVGTGFVTSRARASDVRAPNIEYPDQLIRSWKSRPAPAGFGVIGSHWKERAGFAGTYDDAWSKNRQPLLPLDFDTRHYQVVPADQQAPAFLSGGEEVVLKNLTPSGDMRFMFPETDLFMETYFMDGERRNHEPPNLHTVIIEPDFPRVSLIWHSAMECHSKVYQLSKTRIEAVIPGMMNKMTEDDEGGVNDLRDLL